MSVDVTACFARRLTWQTWSKAFLENWFRIWISPWISMPITRAHSLMIVKRPSYIHFEEIFFYLVPIFHLLPSLLCWRWKRNILVAEYFCHTFCNCKSFFIFNIILFMAEVKWRLYFEGFFHISWLRFSFYDFLCDCCLVSVKIGIETKPSFIDKTPIGNKHERSKCIKNVCFGERWSNPNYLPFWTRFESVMKCYFQP